MNPSRGNAVVPEGGANDLLIEARQGFYVFFRPKAIATIFNMDIKPVEELLFQDKVFRLSIQSNSNGYVAFEGGEEAEEFERRINLQSIYEPITLEEWCGQRFIPERLFRVNLAKSWNF